MGAIQSSPAGVLGSILATTPWVSAAVGAGGNTGWKEPLVVGKLCAFVVPATIIFPVLSTAMPCKPVVPLPPRIVEKSSPDASLFRAVTKVFPGRKKRCKGLSKGKVLPAR